MNAEIKSENKKNNSESLISLMSFTADKVIELADANSVAGDIIEIDGMKIIPISKISAGFAGGGATMVNVPAKKSNTPAGSGAKVTVTPMSFLVITDGEVKLVNVSATDKKDKGGLVSKIIEAVKGFKKQKRQKPQKPLRLKAK
ncbi:MAG: sporulation protein YtfJ [Ruminococcaceae bacterium]|nr:sporulation protein YtfJ [Oscillospiraceae bacterium]